MRPPFVTPGAETTDARLHVQMRVTDLDFLTVRAEDLSVGETIKLFPCPSPPSVRTARRQDSYSIAQAASKSRHLPLLVATCRRRSTQLGPV